nr:immunoglobulin heavy chain junction region [Mus musculus]
CARRFYAYDDYYAMDYW